jgi:hypothetical protein
MSGPEFLMLTLFNDYNILATNGGEPANEWRFFSGEEKEAGRG